MITLEEPEVVWPMGLSDHDPSLADRPLVFNPKGFLVAILEDDDHAEQARAALPAAGFADRDLRVYTSQQILADHQRYLAQRSLARRVVGGLTDDTTAPERYSTAPARAAPPCGSMSPPTPTPSGSELQCNLKVEYVEKLTDGPVGVGTRYRARWANSGPTAVEVVQFDSPRRWETNAEARGMAIRFQGTFTDAAEVARYTAYLEHQPRRVAWLVAPFALLAMRRQDEKNRHRIPEALESSPMMSA
jgi:hypothetical protein